MARTASGQITIFDVNDGTNVASPRIYKRLTAADPSDDPAAVARYTFATGQVRFEAGGGGVVAGNEIRGSFTQSAGAIFNNRLLVGAMPNGVTQGTDYVLDITASNFGTVDPGLYLANAVSATGASNTDGWNNLRPITNQVVGNAIALGGNQFSTSITFSIFEEATAPPCLLYTSPSPRDS